MTEHAPISVPSPLARAAARLFGRPAAGPDRIADFLTGNGLEVTPASRVHAQRLLANGPVPDDDEEHAPAAAPLLPEMAPDMLARLIGEAAAKLAEASVLIGRSHEHAHDYSAALESSLSGAPGGEPLLEMVIGLTRTMIDRTQEAEDRLRAMGGEMDEMRGSLDEARRSAEADALTGLANRRGYERRLAEAVAAARIDGSPLSLAVCDIDHFKRINDVHGHAMGDRILRFVAGILRGAEDADTTVARYGGEEFVILFEHVPIEQAERTVDALRRDLGARRLVSRETGQAVGEVTFSAGIAPLGPEDDADDMFRSADAALYAAKQDGRDRIVVVRK